MANRVSLALFCFLAMFAYSTTQSITPIWLSPSNSKYATDPISNFAEPFPQQGVWTSLTSGSGIRWRIPVLLMDSKKTLWIMFGFVKHNRTGSAAMTVWNYNPKTDLYRWVSGPGNATTQLRNPGQLGVPSPDNHPGSIQEPTATIDHNDNIWFMSSYVCCEFWMFNTTSHYFTRVQGLDGSATPPGEVYPGVIYNGCFVTDSQNNLWLLGGQTHPSVTNVWHFNTTSLLWTLISDGESAPSPSQNLLTSGRSYQGCDIDENDRVWLFGGDTTSSLRYPDMWSFDTRSKQWQQESGFNATANSGPVVASSDYHALNVPSARSYASLVDRKDGTLMMTSGRGHFSSQSGIFDTQNDVWLFNKTLKQWKLVYGSATQGSATGSYTNYRAPGSTLPSRFYHGRANGLNIDGDVFMHGGYGNQGSTDPYLKDTWVISQDQCASPTSHKCSSDARCIEEMIGYSCECNEGFVGDGFECTLPQPPSAEPPIESPVPESSVPIALEPPGTQASPTTVPATSESPVGNSPLESPSSPTAQPLQASPMTLAPSSQTPSVQSPRSSIVASGASTIVASLTLLVVTSVASLL